MQHERLQADVKRGETETVPRAVSTHPQVGDGEEKLD